MYPGPCRVSDVLVARVDYGDRTTLPGSVTGGRVGRVQFDPVGEQRPRTWTYTRVSDVTPHLHPLHHPHVPYHEFTDQVPDPHV